MLYTYLYKKLCRRAQIYMVRKEYGHKYERMEAAKTDQ